jgi:putative oxidoreductase
MDVGLLLLRVVVGLTMAAHGAQKLFGWYGGPGMQKVAGFFDSMGLRPGALHAGLAALGEFGGGLLLALGFLTPMGSATITAVMVVAIMTTHRAKGSFNSGGGYEYNLVLVAAVVTVAFTGPGAVSLDHALGLSLSGNRWGASALIAGIVGGGVVLLMRRPPQTTGARG